MEFCPRARLYFTYFTFQGPSRATHTPATPSSQWRSVTRRVSDSHPLPPTVVTHVPTRVRRAPPSSTTRSASHKRQHALPRIPQATAQATLRRSGAIMLRHFPIAIPLLGAPLYPPPAAFVFVEPSASCAGSRKRSWSPARASATKSPPAELCECTRPSDRAPRRRESSPSSAVSPCSHLRVRACRRASSPSCKWPR